MLATVSPGPYIPHVHSLCGDVEQSVTVSLEVEECSTVEYGLVQYSTLLVVQWSMDWYITALLNTVHKRSVQLITWSVMKDMIAWLGE